MGGTAALPNATAAAATAAAERAAAAQTAAAEAAAAKAAAAQAAVAPTPAPPPLCDSAPATTASPAPAPVKAAAPEPPAAPAPRNPPAEAPPQKTELTVNIKFVSGNLSFPIKLPVPLPSVLHLKQLVCKESGVGRLALAPARSPAAPLAPALRASPSRNHAGVPPEQQRLLFAGQIMKDAEPLSSYRVRDCCWAQMFGPFLLAWRRTLATACLHT